MDLTGKIWLKFRTNHFSLFIPTFSHETLLQFTADFLVIYGICNFVEKVFL